MRLRSVAKYSGARCSALESIRCYRLLMFRPNGISPILIKTYLTTRSLSKRIPTSLCNLFNSLCPQETAIFLPHLCQSCHSLQLLQSPTLLQNLLLLLSYISKRKSLNVLEIGADLLLFISSRNKDVLFTTYPQIGQVRFFSPSKDCL